MNPNVSIFKTFTQDHTLMPLIHIMKEAMQKVIILPSL